MQKQFPSRAAMRDTGKALSLLHQKVGEAPTIQLGQYILDVSNLWEVTERVVQFYFWLGG
jgi:hypothetical protein